MSVKVQPNSIELSEFTGGFAPDPAPPGLDEAFSPDVLNLVPDPGSGTPELRKGFVRLDAEGTIPTTHYIQHLNYYEMLSNGSRKRFLVAIVSSGVNASANNVQVWVYDLQEDTFTRVDTAGRSWAQAKRTHWYAVIQNTYYGGTKGELMYSWHPDDGWNASPSAPNSIKTWKDAVNASINSNTEVARDFAFKAGTKVKIGSNFYQATRGIRHGIWKANTDDRYRKSDKVSLARDWGQSGSVKYFKSFECQKAHVPSAALRPGDGTGAWKSYWKPLRLTDPLDEEGKVTRDWTFIPTAAKAPIGTFYGDRLWLRRDDEDDWSRLQFSAPLKPEKDATIADLTFNAQDWAPAEDLDGEGGGWVPFYGQDGDAIRAVQAYGNYLIVCKRWSSYVLSGTNQQTWTKRVLGDYGAVGPKAISEHEGLVYFLSATGALCVTDGTAITEVPGAENIREWLKTKLDGMFIGDEDNSNHPQLISYGRWLWLSLPNYDTPSETCTLVYDPRTSSFWKLDIIIGSMATGAARRAQRLWFSTAHKGVADSKHLIYQYTDDPGDEAYEDDDDTGVGSSMSPISWKWTTAWLQFGARRMERRIRRIWALVRGPAAATVTVKGYRNYNYDSDAFSQARTLVGSVTGEFVEGKVPADCYAIAVSVQGAADEEVQVHGVGIDTQPRRTRYHT